MLIFIGVIKISYSQPMMHINCIMFINGKIPNTGSITGGFYVVDRLSDSIFIPFQYNVGEIWLREDDMNILKGIPDSQFITVIIREIRFERRKQIIKSFTTDIQAGWLRLGYIIFRITETKRGKYYFGITTSNFSEVFIKREYQVLRE